MQLRELTLQLRSQLGGGRSTRDHKMNRTCGRLGVRHIDLGVGLSVRPAVPHVRDNSDYLALTWRTHETESYRLSDRAFAAPVLPGERCIHESDWSVRRIVACLERSPAPQRYIQRLEIVRRNSGNAYRSGAPRQHIARSCNRNLRRFRTDAIRQRK